MGRKRLLTDEFKQRVRQKLDALDKDHRWLEGEIGASRGMVTKMLNPRQNTSALVDPVCRALGIDPPVAEIQGADEQKLVDAYRRMTPEQQRSLIGLLSIARGQSGN